MMAECASGTMRRRQFVAGVVGSGVALAGCTGSDGPGADGSNASSSTDEATTSADEGPQELPESEALVDQHVATVADLAFASEERLEQFSSESEGKRVRAYSVRNGDAGTRVTSEERSSGSDSAQTEELWFTENAEITRDTHRYNPDGVTPPFVQRGAVADIVDIAAFERAEVAGDDEPVYVFEATGVDEEGASEFDAEFETLDVRVEVAASGYLRALRAEITLRAEADADQTSTVTYDYEVSDVGDVAVSPPDFVDDAVRVTGSLSEDRSTLVLEHTGGPAVPEGTELVVQDQEHIASRRPTTFPTAFEPGNTAYVYWQSAEDAALSTGEPPSEVAREFVLPSDDSSRSVYLESRSHTGGQFQVSIDRQA